MVAAVVRRFAAIIVMVVACSEDPVQSTVVEVIAVHPEAAAEETEDGRTLHDLAVLDGRIYAGYGDWDQNTGPVVINPFEVASGRFTGAVHEVPSDAVDTVKVLDGRVWALTTDPVAGESNGGAATGPPWRNETDARATHVFDIASFDGSIYLAGSLGTDAVVWRADGDGWTVVHRSAKPDGSANRFYWIGVAGGRLVVADGAGAFVLAGETWQRGGRLPLSQKPAVQLDDEFLVPNVRGLFLVTPQRTERQLAGWEGPSCVPNDCAPVDVTVDALGAVYVYNADGALRRTRDLVTWTTVLEDGPRDVASVLVHDGRAWFGGDDGRLLRTTAPL